jgi:hypothetical protein
VRTRKPARSSEQYILDSLPRVFKGGEWVSAPEKNGSPVPAEDSTSSRYITVIGGQKYDERGLAEYLAYFMDPEVIVVGAGRGVESDLGKKDFATVIPVDQDRYGKSARKVNVEEVLCYQIDSPLLLVGDGERVKQARAWLKRTNSRREVVELP